MNEGEPLLPQLYSVAAILNHSGIEYGVKDCYTASGITYGAFSAGEI